MLKDSKSSSGGSSNDWGKKGWQYSHSYVEMANVSLSSSERMFAAHLEITIANLHAGNIALCMVLNDLNMSSSYRTTP